MIFLLVFVGFLAHGEATNLNSSTRPPETDFGCKTDMDCPELQPVCGVGEKPGICGCRVSQDCPPYHVCNQSNKKCIVREDLVMVQPVKINIRLDGNIKKSKDIFTLERERKPVKGLCCKDITVGGKHYIRHKKYKKVLNGCLSRCVYNEVGDFSFTKICFKPGNLIPKCYGNMKMQHLPKDKKNIPGKKNKIKKQTRNSRSFGSTNWMSRINNNKRLDELTIPGTHDTMAYKGFCLGCDWVRTQGIDLYKQLEYGVRFIDIRLKLVSGNLDVYHGIFSLYSSLEDVYAHVVYFLKKNPTETILMRYDNKDDKSTVDTFCHYFKKVTIPWLPWIWVPRDKKPSDFAELERMPPIRETRGKLILIPTDPNRKTNGAGCKETGIKPKKKELDNWEGDDDVPIGEWVWGWKRRTNRTDTKTKNKDNKAKHRLVKSPMSSLFAMKKETQSIRKLDLTNQKIQLNKTRSTKLNLWIVKFVVSSKYKNQIAGHLDLAKSNRYHDKLMVTYVSATKPPLLTIRDIASVMNPFVGNYFNSNQFGRFGVVAFDYILSYNSYLPEIVYTTNFESVTWAGMWGYWAPTPTYCPAGSFVYGYRLRIEPQQGGGDDSALNDIELYCRKPGSNNVVKKIWSFYMSWGVWYPPTWCSSNTPVVGFAVREETDQGSGDDTSLNSVALYCGNRYIVNHAGYWGDWKLVSDCSPGKAVIGIQTRVEKNQGGGDDTAMNGVRLFCGDYP